MPLNADALTGGFSSPVFDSQAVFRQVMDGMARPGRIANVGRELGPPLAVGAAMAAIALTLCDGDTPVHLSQAYDKTDFSAWLSFQTGAATVTERSEACFAFLHYEELPPSFGLFALGSLDYPDRSTTLIVELADLVGGSPIVLRGPGIEFEEIVAPQGPDESFLHRWGENRSHFPRGIDLIFTAGSQFLCLPRSVTLFKAEA